MIATKAAKAPNGSIRCRFALRFGDGKTHDDEDQRQGAVRTAFNSPFRPFVLASTSVGQEGLDFHTYCHAIMHWNLPSNPVNFEQREGRVHRYKGHFVRKNLAARYGLAGMRADGTSTLSDPWVRLFERAVQDRADGASELNPYWIFDGEHLIERHVPLLPLSRERMRYDELKSALALYRLVFGQPRQEERLRLLGERFVGTDATALLDQRIDLRTGSIAASQERCDCCGQSRGYKYESSPASDQDVEVICPWCIADGSAHAKFNAEFTGRAGIGDNGSWGTVPDHVADVIAAPDARIQRMAA